MTTTKTTGTVRNILKVLAIGALVIVSTGALFQADKHEHVNSIHSPEYKAHKSIYAPINKERRKELRENKEKFLTLINSENFTPEQKLKLEDIYFKELEIEQTSSSKLKEYTAKKKELQASYKYLGWNAYYYFRLKIDPYIMSFVMGLFLLYVIINPVTEKWKRTVFSVFTSLFLFVSSYVIVQTIFSQRVFNGDFPESWYNTLLFWVPVVVSLALPMLFYHYTTIETKLKSITNKLITFIIDSDKYIDDKEKEKQHLIESMEVFSEIVE